MSVLQTTGQSGTLANRSSQRADGVATADGSAEQLRQRVRGVLGDGLRDVEGELAAALRSDNEFVAELVRHSSRFRGKLLRPMLVLLSAEATSGRKPVHSRLAAVVEMIHVATLVHDDVLDEAEVRRHVATLNNRWNNETSVLFGDYLFTQAFRLAATTGSADVCVRIGDACAKVCGGELRQIRHRGNLELDEATYLKILEGKTAELTALACELGTRETGATTEEAIALEAYGRQLGIAFQIADDWLDLHGVQGEVGKTLGSDIQKQKLTLPLIRLIATASTSRRESVLQLLSHPNEATKTALKSYLAASDAGEYTQRRAAEFVAAAKASLDPLSESPAKTLLLSIADFAIHRRK